MYKCVLPMKLHMTMRTYMYLDTKIHKQHIILNKTTEDTKKCHNKILITHASAYLHMYM